MRYVNKYEGTIKGLKADQVSYSLSSEGNGQNKEVLKLP